MDLFKSDLRKIPRLLIGLVVLALGIYLTKLSLLGMSSWSVFHDGLSIVTNLPFGVVTQLLGLVILVLSMNLLKTKVVLGTLFNIVFIGWFIDIFGIIYSTMPKDIVLQSFVLILGVLFTTLGRSLYIASKLGPGPRDGLFVGISRITKIQVKYVKITIELIVLGIGFLLGGTAGIGTVIIIVASGYLVQFFFKLFHFDSKSDKQSDVLEYHFQDYKYYTLIVGLITLVVWLIPILGIILSVYGIKYSKGNTQKFKVVGIMLNIIGLVLAIVFFIQTNTSFDVTNLFS